jgi:shikimate dehydrogenase
MTESPCAASSGDRYAVMGNPVAHSKSPLIHRLFARQTGDNLCYEALLVSTGGLAPAVAGFLGEGGKGLNITVPFKQDACRIADTLSDRARRAGAVNTLRADPDGRLFGDNTDGIGLIRDLTQNLGLQLEGANILLPTAQSNGRRNLPDRLPTWETFPPAVLTTSRPGATTLSSTLPRRACTVQRPHYRPARSARSAGVMT